MKAESATPILQVDNLSVRYGAIEAVRNVNLTLFEGEVVTILGPNGAGKTTTMEALMGMLPFSGGARYCGESIEHWTTTERVRRGFTLVPESRDLFSDMTVRENLVLGAFSRRFHGRRDVQDELDGVYSVFPRLKERASQLAGTLSGGERQMLAIGRALMLKPRLLMLDEPSLGLAPRIVTEVFNIIGRLQSHGVSVLLVEQNARAALAIADRAYVLETGSIVQEGPAELLGRDHRLTRIYLGLKS
ncbi:ABC transporter ATP-binding protein [Bordetella sp. FB-8]|uniref:ABC transporter ATP-binding protein n=1 Tax=Bordetella sp. FB-8 TaxID=1159870 RepID=UPI000374F4C6|nr:ABC transporter ATP-binding protein [Bordetella sp. FB-8]